MGRKWRESHKGHQLKKSVDFGSTPVDQLTLRTKSEGRKFCAGYQIAAAAYEDCKSIFKASELPSNMSSLPDLKEITARRLKFDSAFAYCTVSQLLHRDLSDGESRQSLLAEGRLLLAEEGLPPQVLAMLSAA